jgi:hypothetical protein
MNINNLYYFTNLPILTCNILFFCITSLSTYITSSKNIFTFIYEHKDSDLVIYKNEIEKLDLENKLKIVHSLISNILVKYNILLNEILSSSHFISEEEGFSMIEMKSEKSNLNKIEEPLLLSLMSTFEIIEKIYIIMNQIKEKIMYYQKSYIKNIITLCLKNEIITLKKYSDIFDIRLLMLFELIKIYK